MTRVKFPACAVMGILFFCHHVQDGSGAHLAICIMGTRGSYPRSK